MIRVGAVSTVFCLSCFFLWQRPRCRSKNWLLLLCSPQWPQGRRKKGPFKSLKAPHGNHATCWRLPSGQWAPTHPPRRPSNLLQPDFVICHLERRCSLDKLGTLKCTIKFRKKKVKLHWHANICYYHSDCCYKERGSLVLRLWLVQKKHEEGGRRRLERGEHLESSCYCLDIKKTQPNSERGC